jgi:hypothetical protein
MTGDFYILAVISLLFEIPEKELNAEGWAKLKPEYESSRSPNPHSLLPNSKSESLWVQV